MKVSIITVSYNNCETIEETIRSVLSQDYLNLEYIIVDGVSTDRSPEVIKGFGDKIAKIISEKDKGMYDAINKGIRAASGDIIGLLHADDLFENNKVVSLIVTAFTENHYDAIYGDLVYVERQNTNNILRSWKSGKYHHGMFSKGWMPPHPTFYAKRELFSRYGFYNTAFRFASDYELMLRFIHKNTIRLGYIPQVLVRMRTGGKSNIRIGNRIAANKEDYNAWVVNGLNPGLIRIIKPLSKIWQFF